MALFWAPTDGEPRFEVPQPTAGVCTDSMEMQWCPKGPEGDTDSEITIPVSSSLFLERQAVIPALRVSK